MPITEFKTATFVLLTIGILVAPRQLLHAAEKSNVKVGATSLTIDEFEQLHQKLTKMSMEKVWSIPWQLSVRKARELAAKEKKPVFLWISSNGGTHPLGPC